MNVKTGYLTKEFVALDIGTDITIEDLKKKYRIMARKHHPDKGGSEEKFKEINTAYQKILTYLSHFVELAEEKIDEQEQTNDTKNSISDKKKYENYLVNKDYLKKKNYLKIYYGIDLDMAYKPFVLYFNINFKKDIDTNNFYLPENEFSGLEMVNMDIHNKLNEIYNSIVNRWNKVSRRKKRIYRGIVKTIETLGTDDFNGKDIWAKKY